MDRTGIIAVSICAALFVLWYVAEQKYYSHPAQPMVQSTNAVAAAQTQEVRTATAAQASGSVTAFDTNTPEQTIVIPTVHARYTFTSRGGGLKQVELLDYPETISARWKKQNGSAANGVATLNARVTVPSLAVLGDSSLIGDGNFSITQIADGVRAEKTLTNGLRVVKEFHIGTNYLVKASVRFENTSSGSIALPAQEIVVGTATPMGPDDNGVNEGTMWYNGSSTTDEPLAWFQGSGLGCFRGAPRSQYTAGSSNVVWAAAHNQFFTIIAMPQDAAKEIIARSVTLPAFTNIVTVQNAPLPKGIQTALVYPGQTLTTNSYVERQITLFAGPKEYRNLAEIGAQYHNRADNVMGFYGVMGFCAKPLLLAMNWIHDVTKFGYGWIIVLITVIIKVVFWPLTAASTRSMKRMAALAPELKELQAKYKDDMQKLTQKQWELYRKNKVSPMSGCLPMLIQMPVFIGFFTMIRSAIELRGAHFLWVTDLSKPDTLFMIPGIDFPFNLLPLLMGAAMLWQSHLTPPSPGMDPSQARIMRYMPLLFLLFLYNYSAGLALYWTVNNLLTIAQTKLTKMNEPAAPAGPTTSPALTPAPKKKK